VRKIHRKGPQGRPCEYDQLLAYNAQPLNQLIPISLGEWPKSLLRRITLQPSCRHPRFVFVQMTIEESVLANGRPKNLQASLKELFSVKRTISVIETCLLIERRMHTVTPGPRIH